ncbi:Flp family type IVb pilin [Roseospirillum parvum]|uniref:Flp pilus assembly protein, pilin Flp n=1 Tax=Roseospirillum parvum TaxID=83401 RepID=A0A1G7TY19_9PROT|nr:Flp family type IVb pilin [Roseospirillum parvum]SDG40088.1 Flp pilus assembly protein, pilin Flp [Roseospirillum parvum]
MLKHPGARLRQAAGRLARRLAGDEDAATTIEYGLIVTGIAMALVVIVFTMGDELENFYTDIQTQIADRND